MLTVGMRELKQQIGKLLRRVREQGDQILITYHGKVVARIVPVKLSAPENEVAWESLDQLAVEIGARWPEGVSAAEAVAEGRQ